ncbi:pentatricopeptide repeat-containing protein At5g16860-like [Selaginella moellendorffii]|uniref:pentatricopeptide repeat-containing protein At5g16860-like n=1 Tax=Selaginella moellendorffii TaxID=88036 RepID=UPI000D1C70C0|nr:pentatricopeptide repeat-containing protein At5g16860-like [Selaginella moellendorffii]|eukprot:XP_024544791.1 pentatricopeptide repeat-containing protein At5g16860-like [Selaginella moellendorffii]
MWKCSSSLSPSWRRSWISTSSWVPPDLLLAPLSCLDRSPSSSLWLAAAKGCGIAKEVEIGRNLELHRGAQRWGLDAMVASNALISMYAKCGSVTDARVVFDGMRRRDVVSWTALILGYVESGQEEVALALFSRSRSRGEGGSGSSYPCVPDARLFVAALKACTSLITREEEDGAGINDCDRYRILETGNAIHHDAVASGHASNLFVQNSLLAVYAKCGSLASATRIFEAMAGHRDVVSWNSLMLGYVDSGEPRLALDLFARMTQRSVAISPDARTFLIAIKACAGLAAAEEGELLADGKLAKMKALESSMAIHSQARACSRTDMFLANALVTSYAKCGSLLDARAAFDKAVCHDVVSWNALILGCAENEEPEMALELQSRMEVPCKPNAPTFVAALKACSIMAELRDAKKQQQRTRAATLERGRVLHSQIVSCRCEADVFVVSALVDMYGKCGSMGDARRVFEETSSRSRNVVTWNSIILGYADNGDASSALELLARMGLEGECPAPNALTFAAALKASCDGAAGLETVKAIHAHVSRSGMEDEIVQTSLVDSYGKCGSIGDCELVFGGLVPSRNSVTWNALLAGHSRVGAFRRTVELFHQMLEETVPVSSVTFVCLLTACSHAGLVDTGRRYFELMVSTFGVSPSLEHYHCLVDMLGRANRIKEAVDVVAAMPFKPTVVTWTTVLSACWKWRDVEQGRMAFEKLVRLDGRDDAACLLMAKLYGSKGMWEEQLKIQAFSCREIDSTAQYHG